MDAAQVITKTMAAAKRPLTDDQQILLAGALAVILEKAVAAERETLRMVADVAHSGGLTGHDEFSALTAIRRLTLAAWNPHGTTDEHRKRVIEAGREAVRRSGA